MLELDEDAGVGRVGDDASALWSNFKPETDEDTAAWLQKVAAFKRDDQATQQHLLALQMTSLPLHCEATLGMEVESARIAAA